MKKFLFIIIAALLLIGCTKKPTDIELLTEVMNSIDIPIETKENIELPKTYIINETEITATWSSSDESIISSEGVIYRSDEDLNATLSLVLKLNEETLTNTFDVFVLAYEEEVIANQILDLISLPTEISENLTLSTSLKYKDNNYKLNWETSNANVLSTKGIITHHPQDEEVTLTATISYNKIRYSKDFTIVVKAFDTTDMEKYLNELTIEKEISSNIALPTSYKVNGFNYSISWSSNNEVLSNNGEVNICLVNTDVTLTATMTIDKVSISKDFTVKVLKSSNDQISEILEGAIFVQKMAYDDIYLPTDLGNGITCEWTSSNENVISSTGKLIQATSQTQEVILTANIKIGEDIMTKEFKTIATQTDHFLLTTNFEGTMENVHINKDGRLVLDEGEITGTFTSKEYDHRAFTELVASWGALTEVNATCELFVSVKVGNKFSDYITYGEWGLGRSNASVDQTKDLIKLNDDEIFVLNSKEGTGFKFKFVLRRKEISTPSPEVFLIALSFKMNNYSYTFDKSLLKDSVIYDVPRLYQHDVPGIGNIICSATSSTMLLKFKGHDFSKINVLEHEYIAKLVKDYGNNIYGNWVYNTVGMSAFNEFAYVKRFASTEEFLYSLQEVGPMAASIKGTVKYTKQDNGQAGSYTSAGHLLVVTGYEITDNGTFIYINDPNVNGVAIKQTLEDFLAVWRNVSYIVE